jgi:4-alpha-glucanotransferase
MVVLHWAWGGSATNVHAPTNHPKRAVVYTSTHDTDTTVGWYAALNGREKARTGLDPKEPHWGLIEIAMQSRAELAIAPLQDVLGLGSDARMNHPGQPYGNWRWQFERGALTGELAARLREATTRGARAVARADR